MWLGFEVAWCEMWEYIESRQQQMGTATTLLRLTTLMIVAHEAFLGYMALNQLLVLESIGTVVKHSRMSRVLIKKGYRFW